MTAEIFCIATGDLETESHFAFKPEYPQELESRSTETYSLTSLLHSINLFLFDPAHELLPA